MAAEEESLAGGAALSDGEASVVEEVVSTRAELKAASARQQGEKTTKTKRVAMSGLAENRPLAPAPKTVVCEVPEDAEKLKVHEVRAELEKRGLDSRGVRSVVVSRLSKALQPVVVVVKKQAELPPPPSKPSAVTMLLSGFAIEPRELRLAFGSSVCFKVDDAEHGAAEYNLVGRLNGEVVFESPPLTRGGSFEHYFDDVGVFAVSDETLSAQIEVFAIVGMRDLKKQIMERRSVEAAKALAARQAEESEAEAAAQRQKEREEQERLEIDVKAKEEAKREASDATLQHQRQAERDSAIAESMAIVKRRPSARRPASRQQSRQQEPAETTTGGKFSRLRTMINEARAAEAPPPEPTPTARPPPELLAASLPKPFYTSSFRSIVLPDEHKNTPDEEAAPVAPEVPAASPALVDDFDYDAMGQRPERRRPAKTVARSSYAPKPKAQPVDNAIVKPKAQPVEKDTVKPTPSPRTAPRTAAPPQKSPRPPVKAAAQQKKSPRPPVKAAAPPPRGLLVMLLGEWSATTTVRAGAPCVFKVDDDEPAMSEYVIVCKDSSDDQVFETQVLSSGEQFKFFFRKEGTYTVFDSDAPDSTATVVVTPAPMDQKS